MALMGWRLVLGISLTAECRALRKLGEAVVLWLGRMIQVLGAGKWVLLPLLTSCPLLVEAAYRGLETTDSVPYFPSVWLKQTAGSHLQLRRQCPA